MTDTDPVHSLILERYNRLATHLGIDMMDMERGFERTPKIMQEAGELAARATEVKNAAKHALEVARATAAQGLRQTSLNGKPLAQNTIDSLLPLDETVQAAQQQLTAAIYEADVCDTLWESFKQQAFLLTKAAEMVVSGYITPAGVSAQRRSEVRRARVAREQQPEQRHDHDAE